MPTAIPMRSTTSEVFCPTGSQWPGMASREIAVITAVAASSSGMPAAISAPNTATSKTSVIGTEVTSALRKSGPTQAPPPPAPPPPPGGQQRAKPRPQKAQRDRHRGALAPPEVGAHRGADRPVAARVPGLLDEQVRVAALDGRDRVQATDDGLVYVP